AGLARAAARLGALLAGQDEGPLHRLDRGGRPPLAARQRARVDDRRILAAARLDGRADATRGLARKAGRAHGRDPASDWPGAPGELNVVMTGEGALVEVQARPSRSRSRASVWTSCSS